MNLASESVPPSCPQIKKRRGKKKTLALQAFFFFYDTNFIA